MIAQLQSIFGGRYAVPVGRAAWGIAVLLKVLSRRGREQKIALPSFLCQSPLAAVLLAGWQPHFCDIDPETGLVSLAEIKRAVHEGVEAMLIVHLFGNPFELGEAFTYCRQHGVFVIEDIAQALGAETNIGLCGTLGDAAVLSFGQTKMIETGGGAVISHDRDLIDEIESYNAHMVFESELDIMDSFERFRKAFYSARNRLVAEGSDARHYFHGLIEQYLPLIPRSYESGNASVIADALANIDTRITVRRDKAEIYHLNLADNPYIQPVGMGEGSVPWRYCFRIPGVDWGIQDEISHQARFRGIHISNWYIPTHWMSSDERYNSLELPESQRMSQEIFQLWLDDNTSPEQVKINASVINQVVEEQMDGG
jgi:dTDP-4-amino-4,6-dideoxygalactose transaminase